MLMHVNGKKTAVSGLLMAVSVLLIILSGLIETNTLFLLAAAAFCTGIIVREYDWKTGTAFFAGCLLIGNRRAVSFGTVENSIVDGKISDF